MKLTPWDPDVKSIVDRILDEDIDLQPDFQRQEVWPPSKKRKLVDTILRGWSIPPIHLVVTKDGQMDVLDGQQRLATIRDFVGNKFRIDGRITPYDSNIESLDGMFYKNLPNSVRRSIDQYSLRCFRITDYLPDEPSELFYRLNQPTMLTAGEQRNALYGMPREQLKEVVRFFEELGNDRATIGFSNARLAYDDVIARLIYFLERGSFAIKGSESLISERFRNKEGFSEKVILATRNAISHFTSARSSNGKWKFNKASVLSLLIFYSRFSTQNPEQEFLNTVFGDQNQAQDITDVMEAISLFKDRSSLRVTDVSSVVLRDFALCYIYFRLFRQNLPKVIDTNAIREVHKEMRAGERDLEFAAAKFIDIDQWGASL